MRTHTMPRASVNGLELEYDVIGHGEPVLLINSVLADGFLPLLSEPALANRYQLITYHKRGWMGSTRTAGPVSIGDHAADAAALLRDLGVRQAHVAGHSSGAAVAVQLALTEPELVHSLALLELPLMSIPGGAAFLQKAGPAFETYGSGDHEAAMRTFLTMVSGLEWNECRAVLDKNAPGAIAAGIKDADMLFGIEFPAVAAWPFGADQAARVSQPVLSVLGSRTDALWVEVAEVLRSWFKDVEECTIRDAGHLLQIQQPEAVAHALASFFDRHRMTAS